MTKPITASIFLVFSLTYLLVGLQYPMLTDDGQFGAGFFPRTTGVVLVGLCAWNLHRERGAESPRMDRADVRNALVILALIAGYIFGMYLVGTVIPTAVFTLALLVRFNRGRLVANVAFAGALTASVYVAFGVWFNAPLPEGLFTVAGLP